MWRELAFFARDAQRFERFLDCPGKCSEVGAGLGPGPENTGAAVIVEKSQAVKSYGDRSAWRDRSQRRLCHFSLFGRCFADVLKSNVQAFESRPARVSASGAQLGGQLRKRTAHILGNIHRDEKAHAVSPLRCFWAATRAANIGAPG